MDAVHRMAMVFDISGLYIDACFLICGKHGPNKIISEDSFIELTQSSPILLQNCGNHQILIIYWLFTGNQGLNWHHQNRVILKDFYMACSFCFIRTDSTVFEPQEAQRCGNVIQNWLIFHEDVITLKHFPHSSSVVKSVHLTPMDSQHKGTVMLTFGVSFVISMNKRLSKLSSCRWSDTPWWSCAVIVMYRHSWYGWKQRFFITVAS